MQDFPVEIEKIDISAYKNGNTGIDYVHAFDSGVDGPHVMVNTLVHGNELCGAHVVKFLFDKGILTPKRGTFSVAIANHQAYDAFDANNPLDSRYIDEDMNRVWGTDVLTGDRQTLEVKRARSMRPHIDTVDYLLDIHSMSSQYDPVMLSGTTAGARKLSQQVGYPKWIVSDAGHAAGKRLLDYGDFADEQSSKTALLVEAGQHWESKCPAKAIQTTLRFLLALDIFDADTLTPHLNSVPLETQQYCEIAYPVTAQTDAFKFNQFYKGMTVIKEAGTVIAHDGETVITTPHNDCVLLMPQNRPVAIGNTAVRLGTVKPL